MNEAATRAVLFRRLAESVLAHPRKVIVGVLAMAVSAALVGLPPRIEGDLVRLLPGDDPAAMALDAHRASPGGEGIVAVTVRANSNLAEIAARIEALPGVSATFHGLDANLALKLALLNLPTEAIDATTQSLRRAVAARNPGLARLPDAPPPLLPDLLGSGPHSDEKVVFVVPARSPRDPDFSEGLLSDLERTVPDAVWIAGPHAEIARTARELAADFRNTSIYSLFLVLAIVGVAFRHAGGLLILIPPLLAANVMAIALVQLVAGSLNMYTSMGGAILLGLGIDFGVHLVSRYRAELGTGLSPSDAVSEAWVKAGPPCLTAALTSAAGFLVFLTAGFRGLSQLGLLLAIGVVLSLFTMLLLLPILLTRVNLRPRPPAARAPVLRNCLPWCLGASVLVTAALVAEIPGLEVEYDISALRGEGVSWQELTPAQQRYRQNAFPPVVLRTADRTALHGELQAAVDAGVFTHVRGVVSVDSLLPPDQTQRLEALDRLVRAAQHPASTLLPEDRRAAVARIAALDTTPVGVDDLPAGLVHLIGGADGRVLLLLRGNMLDFREAHAMAEELRAYRDDAANEFLAHASVYDLLARDLPRIGILALLIVTAIIAIDLRAPRLIAIATGSLLLGLLWAFGALAALDVRLNMVNVVALPMLLGIGIDVVVHLLHRLRDGSSIHETLETTGIACLVSTLTTIAAFLSLTMAENRGLQSIGVVILIGLSSVFLAAVLVVQAGWRTVGAPRS